MFVNIGDFVFHTVKVVFNKVDKKANACTTANSSAAKTCLVSRFVLKLEQWAISVVLYLSTKQAIKLSWDVRSVFYAKHAYAKTTK